MGSCAIDNLALLQSLGSRTFNNVILDAAQQVEKGHAHPRCQLHHFAQRVWGLNGTHDELLFILAQGMVTMERARYCRLREVCPISELGVVNPIKQEPRHENRIDWRLWVVSAGSRIVMEFTPGLFNGLWTQGFKTISQQLRNQVGLDPAPTAIVKILFVETRLTTLFVFSPTPTWTRIVSANFSSHQTSRSESSLALLSLH